MKYFWRGKRFHGISEHVKRCIDNSYMEDRRIDCLNLSTVWVILGMILNATDAML